MRGGPQYFPGRGRYKERSSKHKFTQPSVLLWSLIVDMSFKKLNNQNRLANLYYRLQPLYKALITMKLSKLSIWCKLILIKNTDVRGLKELQQMTIHYLLGSEIHTLSRWPASDDALKFEFTNRSAGNLELCSQAAKATFRNGRGEHNPKFPTNSQQI